MNNNFILIILAIAMIGGGLFLNIPNEKVEDDNALSNIENNSITDNDKVDENSNSDKKVLVVYYSATNNTKNVAEIISQNVEATLFEIEPVEKYTNDDLDWNDDNSRVSVEHNDESKRNVELKTTTVDNWSEYDTILIGYPIWWGVAAWPVDNFVKNNDFTGKTVIPFCTSTSSSLGNSGKLLEEMAGTGNWQEGHRFRSGADEEDIKTWLEDIGLK